MSEEHDCKAVEIACALGGEWSAKQLRYLATMVGCAEAAGAVAERAKVVAELKLRARQSAIMRSMKMTEQARTLESLARCIEAGEHDK